MQLLSLVAMEPPATFEADALRDEKVKVLRAIAPLTPERGRGRRRPRPVRPGLGRRPAGRRATAGAEVDPESETETFVAARFDDRRLALGRRPVLRADRQAAAEARDRDRDPVPAGPPPAVQGQLGRPGAEPARPADPARRGDPAPLRGQGPRPRARRPGGEHGLHLRLGVQRRFARRLRDAHPRRAPRRRVAVHPGRRGRGGLEHRHPDHRRLARHAGARLPELRGRLVGPGGGRRADGRARDGDGDGSDRHEPRPGRATAPLDVAGDDDRRDRARAGQDLGRRRG